MDSRKLLTRREAAEILGVQAQTLAAWAMTQKYNLPLIRVGRSVRYRMSDLETWLAARTIGPSVPAATGAREIAAAEGRLAERGITTATNRVVDSPR